MKTRIKVGASIAAFFLLATGVSFLILKTQTKATTMNSKNWTMEKFGELQGLARATVDHPKSVVILMHGYGSNEEDLVDLAAQLSPESAVVSFRAPITLAPGAYAWFQTDFQKSPPQANEADARESFARLQIALQAVAQKFNLPLNKFAIMGFSQGAIMTLGLNLASENDFGAYIAFSGRLLPDFEKAAKTGDPSRFERRPLLVFHGTRDSKIAYSNAEHTEQALKNLHSKFIFQKFEGDHTIVPEEISFARDWLQTGILSF